MRTWIAVMLAIVSSVAYAAPSSDLSPYEYRLGQDADGIEKLSDKATIAAAASPREVARAVTRIKREAERIKKVMQRRKAGVAIASLDALDTPAWRDMMHSLNTSTNPDAFAWAGLIRSYSDSFGTDRPDLAVWDYLYSVMVEIDDPGKAADKMAEFIETAHAMMVTPPGTYHYTHNPYMYALFYSRAKPFLTVEREAVWRANMEAIARYVLGPGVWGPVTPLDDDDMLVGHWALVLTIDQVLGTSFKTLAIEGGTSFDSMTGQVNKWLDASMKGDWVTQSSQYNPGTDRELIITGAFVGLANQPKISAYCRAIGEHYRWFHTPEPIPRDVIQFGDEEWVHHPTPHYRAPLYFCINASGGAPEGHRWHLAKAFQPVATSGFWIAHHHALIVGFNPANQPASPSITHPTGSRQSRYATYYRTTDTVVHVFCPINIGVHHEMSQWNVQWWDKGEWVGPYVIAYMPWSRNHQGSECYGFAQYPYNSTMSPVTELAGGFEVNLRTKHPTSFGGWDPPPPFIKQWDRRLRFVNGILSVKDRVDAAEPTRLDRFDGMGWSGTLLYSGRIAPLAQFFHTSPGRAPTPIDGGFTYLTAGGTEYKLLTNAPVRSTAIAEYGVNVGTYLDVSGTGGTIMQLGAQYEIETVIGKAANPLLVPPGPPGPPPEPGVPPDPPPVDPPPVDPPPVDDANIVNDTLAVFTGDWTNWATSGYGGNLHFTLAGDKTAEWTGTVTPGKYSVYATWPADPNRATNAAFNVYAGDVHKSASIDQEKAPDDLTAAGVGWEKLADIDVAGTKIIVTLSAVGANENVIADAIYFKRTGDLPTTPPVDPPTNPPTTSPAQWFWRTYPDGKKEIYSPVP